MTPQTASAVELIVRAVFGAVPIVRHDRAPGLAAAVVARQARPGDLCVVDLLGFGWARWSTAHEQALRLELIGPRPAIVLLPPGGGDWPIHLADHAGEHGSPAQPRPGSPLRLMLPHPASMTAMRGALQRHCDAVPDPGAAAAAPRARLGSLAERVRALVQPLAPTPPPALALAAAPTSRWPDTLPPPPPPPAPRVAPRAAATAAPVAAPVAALVAAPVASSVAAPVAAPVASPAPAAPRAEQAFRLGAEARAAVAAACPAVAANPFLSLVLGVVTRDTPHAFHIGRQTGAIFDPQHNWVASNIATALRKRLTQHRLMLEIAEVQALDTAQAQDQARSLYGRRGDGRRALDGFLWALVYNTFEDELPAVDGTLGLQLRRLPNFTRLPPVPDAFVQMALLCLQGPQSVAALRRAYPAVHPDQVGLFALCALLSGLAVATPGPDAGHGARTAPPSAAAPPPPAGRAAAPQRSFIRSLLAKLF